MSARVNSKEQLEDIIEHGHSRAAAGLSVPVLYTTTVLRRSERPIRIFINSQSYIEYSAQDDSWYLRAEFQDENLGEILATTFGWYAYGWNEGRISNRYLFLKLIDFQLWCDRQRWCQGRAHPFSNTETHVTV